MAITLNGSEPEFVSEHTKMQSRLIVKLRKQKDRLQLEVSHLKDVLSRQHRPSET